MTARMIRTLALGAGAAALVVGAAAPAMAADPVNHSVTTLPSKVVVAKSDTVTVTIDTPANFTCAQAASLGAVGWSTKVVGQKAAVASVSAVNCGVAGKSTWTISIANLDTKKNAVVKFIATTTAATDTAEAVDSVKSLVVKLNPKAKPATGKPAKS